MSEELILVKQLPIIEEQLIKVSKEIDIKISNAKSLVCNEETKKTVKNLRADLKKEFEEWEEKRKDIKEKILNPYNQFETAYKKYIGDKYKEADKELKEKIETVENEQKEKIEKEVKDYFEEYKTNHNLDFINFENTHVKIGLSSSLKSLKQQVKDFIDKVLEEIQVINAQEYRDEIMIEYKQTLNASKAITDVLNRKEMLKKEQEIKERQSKEKEELQNNLDKFKNSEILEAPKEEKIISTQLEEEKLQAVFCVEGTRTKLKLLKEFIVNNGMKIIK